MQPLRSACTSIMYDERGYEAATLAVEGVGRLGKEEGSDLIHLVAARTVGGKDGSSLAKKDVCKKCLST